MNKDRYICLFANCLIVQGHSRAMICDIQRNDYHFIPNSLANLFSGMSHLNVNAVYKDIESEYHHVLDDYIKFLIENELAFELENFEEVKNYPKLDLKWDYPAKISNLLIDISENYPFDYFNILKQAEQLCCRHVQIRYYRKAEYSEIQRISQIIADSNFTSVQLILMYEDEMIPVLTDMIKNNIKTTSIVLYNSPEDSVIFDTGGYGVGKILAAKENIIDEKNCGCIHHSYFAVNIESFSESENYNSCLNRKIAIDKNGFIKNCPSMKNHFGHISNTELVTAVEDKKFKKMWHINKDQIHVCKDCEFRHICTDCRAYVEDPEDILSKPLKCGYNPYTGEWSEWSTNPLKQKAIEHYGMQDLVAEKA